ncbi:hypothetical protein R3P38DRAFT_2814909 [Favolaschia claudopus]|uniref:Uncharacterized protein n=1 Tax=Favolaschia claudopus TaxID=2862362 RepID=A0AAV9Z2U0_9AGAR
MLNGGRETQGGGKRREAAGGGGRRLGGGITGKTTSAKRKRKGCFSTMRRRGTGSREGQERRGEPKRAEAEEAKSRMMGACNHNNYQQITRTTRRRAPTDKGRRFAPAVSANRGIEAITIFGSFDDLKGGHISFDKHKSVIQTPSGTTYLVPSASKSSRYAAIAKGEHRYQFRQFISAGVMRWVEKGGRTDRQFDESSSAAQREAWRESRLARGSTAMKFFSHIDDISS